MLIPMPIPVPGEAGQSAIIARPVLQARAPLTFVFTTAGVDVAVEHGLGREPEGWKAVRLSAPIVLYDGAAPSSKDLLILRASGAGTASVLPL